MDLLFQLQRLGNDLNSELNSSESSSPAPSAIITEPRSSIFLHIKNRPLPAYAQRAVLCRKIGQQRQFSKRPLLPPAVLSRFCFGRRSVRSSQSS